MPIAAPPDRIESEGVRAVRVPRSEEAGGDILNDARRCFFRRADVIPKRQRRSPATWQATTTGSERLPWIDIYPNRTLAPALRTRPIALATSEVKVTVANRADSR